MRHKKERKGHFTLIEMMVAIAIIAVIAGIITPLYLNHIDEANVTAAKVQIKMLDEAIMSFRIHMGRIPDASVGLQELIENSSDNKNWKGPYLQEDIIPVDPWNNPFIYNVRDDGTYELISYGADGQAGGTGINSDISNRGSKQK